MRPCAEALGGAEALGEQAARLGQVGGRQALQLVQGQGQVDGPLRRVADERGGLDAERIGDLAQHQQRGIAGAALELGQIALGHARRLGQRLARHAPAGARQPHALAHALEVGLVGRRRPAPRVWSGSWPDGHAIAAACGCRRADAR